MLVLKIPVTLLVKLAVLTEMPVNVPNVGMDTSTLTLVAMELVPNVTQLVENVEENLNTNVLLALL